MAMVRSGSVSSRVLYPSKIEVGWVGFGYTQTHLSISCFLGTDPVRIAKFLGFGYLGIGGIFRCIGIQYYTQDAAKNSRYHIVTLRQILFLYEKRLKTTFETNQK